jgi:transcriptional regulator GlxA family with amidase domain
MKPYTISDMSPMSARLFLIQNWSEIARRAKWSAAVLAKDCGVSERTLRRYFLKTRQQGPGVWLAKERLRHAHHLLDENHSVKETAIRLGYQQSYNFSRQFKKHSGINPSVYAAQMTGGLAAKHI